jgi:hypothetical protein
MGSLVPKEKESYLKIIEIRRHGWMRTAKNEEATCLVEDKTKKRIFGGSTKRESFGV